MLARWYVCVFACVLGCRGVSVERTSLQKINLMICFIVLKSRKVIAVCY